jgi:hypothetical protein
MTPALERAAGGVLMNTIPGNSGWSNCRLATKVRYRKITTRIWGDERFRALSAPNPNAQSLWIYLLTGPHTNTIPGLFPAGKAALAEALKWSRSGFEGAFKEITEQGMAKADWEARVVWIPKAIRHNEPESPDVVRGWRTNLAEIPECDLKREAMRELGSHLKAKGPAWASAWQTACGAGSVSVWAEAESEAGLHQDQEQEQNKNCTPPGEPAAPVISFKARPELRLGVLPTVLAEHRKLFLNKFKREPKHLARNCKEALKLEKQYGVEVVIGWIRRFFDAPGQWWTDQGRYDFDAFAKASTINWLIASAASPAGNGTAKVGRGTPIADAWAGQQSGDLVIR